jgi:RNA polymerase sigma-32 factor
MQLARQLKQYLCRLTCFHVQLLCTIVAVRNYIDKRRSSFSFDETGLVGMRSASRVTAQLPEISRYLAEIKRYPMLEAQEELRLIKRWRDTGDRRALETLIGSHLRLVVKIAKGYAGYGISVADLISEGHIGLMLAVERFEPQKGFRLSTYAVWWIRAQIQEHILRSWSLVRLGKTANQRRLFFNLRKLKSRLSPQSAGDLHPEQADRIARILRVSGAEVLEMDRRLIGDLSLNAPSKDGGQRLIDWLADETQDQETRLAETSELMQRRKALARALSVLDKRERRIFEARLMAEEPASLGDLAAEFRVSRERVRQINERAYAKVKRLVAISDQQSRLKGGCLLKIKS